MPFFRRAFSALTLLCTASALCADPAAVTEPFPYPTGLLDAPATLSTPAGNFLQLGKPRITLEQTKLADIASRTDATRLREGEGDFERDLLCFTGTEHGRPLIVWLIATESETVTEAQIEWLNERTAPEYCRRLSSEMLPVRTGKIGLGMTETEVVKLLGAPSYRDCDGWYYWFSQTFGRGSRSLQKLTLSWLAVRFDEKGLSVQSFVSQVTNL